MAMQYRHRPLPDKNSTRILEVQPAATTDSNISISLVPAKLDDPPEYTALSYSWDAQSPSIPVHCTDPSTKDHGILLITENCAAAIRQLRGSESKLSLWIDSICIDQTSKAERNVQVANMAEIYKKATSVVVWLGARDPATDKAIDCLITLSDTTVVEGVANSDIELRDTPARLAFQKKLHDRARSLMSDVQSARDDLIKPLFERTFFHRMWCVQETVLPMSDKVTIQCGDKLLNWTTLLMSLDILNAIRYPHDDWKKITLLQKHLSILILCKRFPIARQVLDSNPGDNVHYPVLSYMLLYSRAKAATEAVDKVFALYGVCRELDVPMERPDYDKSIRDVYTEAARISITFDKMLNFILFHAPSDNRRDGLPSWVPDYSDVGWADSDSRYPLTRNQFAAGGSADAKYEFVDSVADSLTVYGRVTDTIMWFKAPALRHTGLPPSMEGLTERDANGKLKMSPALKTIYDAVMIMKEWIDVFSWSNTPLYPETDESVHSALQRTLIADIAENNAQFESGDAYRAWYKTLTLSDLEVLRTAVPDVPSNTGPEHLHVYYEHVPKEFVLMLALVKGPGSPAWSFLSTVFAFSAKKAFYRTESGRFGMVPEIGGDDVDGESARYFDNNVQAGDKIAVVAGLEMPVVLREIRPEWEGEEKKYKLITHCYCHGLMHGEGMPDEGKEEAIMLI